MSEGSKVLSDTKARNLMVRCLMKGGLSQEAAEEEADRLEESTRVDDPAPRLGPGDEGFGEEVKTVFGIVWKDPDAPAEPEAFPVTSATTIEPLRRIGLRPAHQRMSFDTFFAETPAQTAALALAKDRAAHPGEMPGFILVGPTGCGKTHLAVALLKEIVAQHARIQGAAFNVRRLARDVMFRGVLEFLHEVRAAYGHSGIGQDPTDLALTAKVLVLDDLGRERSTDWVADELMLVIQRRYDERLPTFITSNLDDGEALHERYGDTFLSRWMDREAYEIVLMGGKDHRLGED